MRSRTVWEDWYLMPAWPLHLHYWLLWSFGVLVLVLLVVLVGFWVLAGNRLVGWVVELLLPLLLLPEIPRTLLIFCIPKQAFCIVSFCKNATICNANKCMQFQMSNSNLQRLVGQCLLNQFLGAPSFFNIIYHVREFPNKSMIPSSLTLNQQ